MCVGCDNSAKDGEATVLYHDRVEEVVVWLGAEAGDEAALRQNSSLYRRHLRDFDLYRIPRAHSDRRPFFFLFAIQ